MKFGMFGGARPVPGVEDGYHEGYNAYIDAVVEAEALGYYSNFLVEHHFSGMGQVSASLNLLSYLAAMTKTIRLGTAVVVLPWHNPVLIAEQAATVDLLSNGRFDFGVGKGYRYNEFEGFCIPIEESTERFEEAVAVIRKAWTTEGRFSHHGKRWHYEDIIVEPMPTQKPHPPLWLAAGRPESLRYAAREGYNLFLDQFQTFEVILERLKVYRHALTEAGRAHAPLGVAVARGLLIAKTDEEREAAITARMKSQEVMNAFGMSSDGKAKSSMVSDPDLRKAAVEGTLLGTPKEIIERLKWLEGQGVDYVLLSSRGKDGLRLFAEEVMPAFS
ncbi:MAG: LLM class flavin-dependent oxidoreductase [Alphaproteobacteria bacterium]|nr:LLM class flavin-dependent oxidoreductase [Alphaproteobacteria bacterium]